MVNIVNSKLLKIRNFELTLLLVKIFLIDDDVDDWEMFCNVLETILIKFNLIESADVQEAKDLIENVNCSVPDVIF